MRLLYALVISLVTPTPTRALVAESSKFSQDTAAFTVLAGNHGVVPEDIHHRPSAGQGADTVHIGILCKAFYGVDMKGGTSTLDIVTSATWSDPRVKSLVPAGTSSLTLSEPQAAQVMWLPDLTISNRDIRGLDRLSSSTTIHTNGLVTKTDRMMVIVRIEIDVRAFPWDTQELVVLASSGTLMSNDLVFAAVDDDAQWGVDPMVFRGKDLAFSNATMGVFSEKLGLLAKSRARLGITLHRVASAYVPTLLMPEMVVVALGNSVFFLPLIVPFAMPRVAMSVISVLSVLAHWQASAAMLPVGGSLSWVSIFQVSTLGLVFACCMFNVLVEGVNHQQQNPELANELNKELKLLMPFLTILTWLTCCLFRGPDSIATLSLVVQCELFFALGVYSFSAFYRCRDSATEKR